MSPNNKFKSDKVKKNKEQGYLFFYHNVTLGGHFFCTCPKGICYGRDPVVISLQLTNFQNLISLRMNHIVFGEDPKSHLPVSRTCTFFKYSITANGKNDILGEKIHKVSVCFLVCVFFHLAPSYLSEKFLTETIQFILNGLR